MDKHSATARFLQEVFPDYGTHAIFACTKAGGGLVHTRDFTRLDDTRDCYLDIAAFKPEARTHSQAGAIEVRCLVIDDVGTKVPELAVEMGLGTPTAVVLTSEGNAQWWYRLAVPVPIAAWPGFFAEVERRVRHRLDGRDAVHLFRAPMGVNTKPERGGFTVCLAELNPGITLRGIDHDKITQPAVTSTSTRPSQYIHDIKRLVAFAPNNVDYHGWIAVGQQIVALAIDKEDGREAFHEFSARNAEGKYNLKQDTETTWQSFTGERTEGGLLIDAAWAAGGEAFEAYWQTEAGPSFDDGVVHPTPGPTKPARAGITATPYKWVDPDKIPPRDWLYGNILIRQFISMTVAPGGVGKSSLIAVEALAQATGQNLLGEKPSGALRVWLWNLEDPGAETTRKLQAAAKHYGISEADIGDRLFVDSGRDQKLVIAQMDRNGPMIVRPVIGALVEQIKLRKIDIVVIDPFVSCHEVPENDNTAQDMVVKEWGRVADLGGCAVHLVDHTRKGGAEVTTESSRGGKAKTDAARVVRVVNRMSDNQSMTFGVLNPWLYFNTFNDKSNMAPPVDRRDWFFMESVGLGNGGTAAAVFATGAVGAGVALGDDVGVVRRWVPPSAMDLVTGDNFKAMVAAMGTELWRKDYQAKEKWIGVAAAQALNLDHTQPKDRKAIKDVVSQWFKAGLLKEVSQTDENRKTRKFIKITGGF